MSAQKFCEIAFFAFLIVFVLSPLSARSANKPAAAAQVVQQGWEAYELQDYSRAFKLLQAPAKAGNPKAEYLLGMLYLYGEGVPKNLKKGNLLIQKAAHAGSPDACYELYKSYLKGENGLTVDLDAALKWRDRAMTAYRTLAEKGYPHAAEKLAFQANDDAARYKWYRIAYLGYRRRAQKGDISAMESLGRLYTFGEGVKKDSNEEKKWYQAAINKLIPMTKHGDADLMMHVADVYENMNDYPHEMVWSEKAAAKGSGEAADLVGDFYHGGWGGIKKDDSKALQWYQESVKLGYQDGLTDLAGMYAHGEGVVQNGQEAIRLYQECADHGVPSCLESIGGMYNVGTGVKKDINTALKWYERAAASGDDVVGEWLGSNYYYGDEGYPQDYSQALHWYQSCPGVEGCNLGAGQILIEGKSGTPNPYGAFEALRLFWYQEYGRYDEDDFFQAWGETISALKKLSSAGEAPAAKILTENAKLISDIQQIIDRKHQKGVSDAQANFNKDLKSLESNQDFLNVWNGSGVYRDWRAFLDIDYQSDIIFDAAKLAQLNAYPDAPADVETNIKTAEDKWKSAEHIQDYVDAENLLKSAVMSAPWLTKPYGDLSIVESDLHEYDAAANLLKEGVEAAKASEPDWASYPEEVSAMQTVKDHIAKLKAKADAHKKAYQIVEYWYLSDRYNIDPNGAIQKLSQAVQMDPNYVGAHIGLAWAYYRNKQYREAYNTAIEVGQIPFGRAKLMDFTKDWQPEGFTVSDYINFFTVKGLAAHWSEISGDDIDSNPLDTLWDAVLAYRTVIECCPGQNVSLESREQAVAHFNIGVIILNLQPVDVDRFLDGPYGGCTMAMESYSDCSKKMFDGYDITDYNQRRQYIIHEYQRAVQLDPGNAQYQQALNNLQGR